jgi:hypothetical protein
MVFFAAIKVYLLYVYNISLTVYEIHEKAHLGKYTLSVNMAANGICLQCFTERFPYQIQRKI